MDRHLAVGFILLIFLHNFVWAKTENKYFVVGKSLGLRVPSDVGPINNIIWKHQDSFVAEWAKGDADVQLYSSFKGRTKLNTNSGYLEITAMTANDAGVYTVDINGVLLGDTYMAIASQEVPKPVVWLNPMGDDYQLTCEGDVKNVGPVTYWWDVKEDVDWVDLGQRVRIEKNETTLRLKTFSCKIVNPVSEAESEPKPNPWVEEQEKSNPALGAIAVPFILILIGAGLAYWKKDAIKAKCCSGGSPVGAASPPAPDNNEVVVPLKEGNTG